MQFDFVFQLVKVQTLIGVEIVIVTMRPIMMAVALMVVTVVDLMSRLHTAQNVNAWEKISRAHLHQELFVLAQWKVQ
jgi:hypothetical protein